MINFEIYFPWKQKVLCSNFILYLPFIFTRGVLPVDYLLLFNTKLAMFKYTR